MEKNGTYTISSPRGGHRTFEVKTQAEDSKFLPGKRVVSLLRGPNNEQDYESFGVLSPDSRAIFVWRKFRSKFGGSATVWEKFADMLLHPEHYTSYGYEYLVAERCRRCNRRLTTPESIAAGIGPECATRHALL